MAFVAAVAVWLAVVAPVWAVRIGDSTEPSVALTSESSPSDPSRGAGTAQNGPPAGQPEHLMDEASPCTSLDEDGNPLSMRELISPTIRLCETSTVSVTLRTSCGQVPLHVMLNIDHSGSMIGQAWQDAKEAALALIGTLDMQSNPHTKIGLVSHGFQPDLVRLSDSPGPVLGKINSINPGGEDNLPSAIDRGARELISARDRIELQSFDVMVILSDGGQTFPPSQAVSAAGRAKAQDILVVAVCMENGASACAQMRQMATSSQFYFESRGTSGLSRIFREIADDLKNISLRQMAVEETLPDGVGYVPGSGVPEPSIDGQTLKWNFRFLPKTGVTFTYDITASDVTTYTLAESDVTFMDSQQRSGAVVVPTAVLTISSICAIPGDPTPTATPTNTPRPATDTPTPTPTSTPTPTLTPTPIPGEIYLPILGYGRCIERDRPLDVALAIDASSSMTGMTSAGRTKLEAAVEAARGFVSRMRPGEHLAIIEFNGGVRTLSGLTGDQQALQTALDAVQWNLHTRIDLALMAARTELQSERGQAGANRVIVLMTDGRPTETTTEAVLAEAQLVHEAGILVFTVGLGPDVDADLLIQIAGDQSRYFAAPDGEDLNRIYGMIREKLPCK